VDLGEELSDGSVAICPVCGCEREEVPGDATLRDVPWVPIGTVRCGTVRKIGLRPRSRMPRQVPGRRSRTTLNTRGVEGVTSADDRVRQVLHDGHQSAGPFQQTLRYLPKQCPAVAALPRFRVRWRLDRSSSIRL
jgi:hypothetical protein